MPRTIESSKSNTGAPLSGISALSDKCVHNKPMMVRKKGQSPAVDAEFFPMGISSHPDQILMGAFRVRGTCPTVGKSTRTGCPGEWSGFAGSLVSCFPANMDGGLGQNAVSHGHPLIPHRLFTLIAASGTCWDHPSLWGFRALL